MLLVDRRGLPLSIDIESANVNEVKLVERLVECRMLPKLPPERLIYDKAAGSNPLRARMAEVGVDLICPTRKNRKYGPMPDKRKLLLLLKTLNRGTNHQLAPQLPADRRSMGTPRLSIQGIRSTGSHCYSLEQVPGPLLVEESIDRRNAMGLKQAEISGGSDRHLKIPNVAL